MKYQALSSLNNKLEFYMLHLCLVFQELSIVNGQTINFKAGDKYSHCIKILSRALMLWSKSDFLL